MSDLEPRVTNLETRVDELTVEVRRATDLGVEASRNAKTAQAAHQHNVRLLTALRRTQAEHTATLAEHTATLAEHTGRFDRIDASLARLTVGMHAIEGTLRRLIDKR